MIIEQQVEVLPAYDRREIYKLLYEECERQKYKPYDPDDRSGWGIRIGLCKMISDLGRYGRVRFNHRDLPELSKLNPRGVDDDGYSYGFTYHWFGFTDEDYCKRQEILLRAIELTY